MIQLNKKIYKKKKSQTLNRLVGLPSSSFHFSCLQFIQILLGNVHSTPQITHLINLQILVPVQTLLDIRLLIACFHISASAVWCLRMTRSNEGPVGTSSTLETLFPEASGLSVYVWMSTARYTNESSNPMKLEARSPSDTQLTLSPLNDWFSTLVTQPKANNIC